MSAHFGPSSGVRRLFRLPWTRTRAVRDMDDELRAHLAMRIDELRARGMSEAEAEAEALRRFGDTDEYRMHVARRAARQARWRGITEWIDEWMQDIRFSGRQFRRNAGFTALAVATLALGIGANAAIFTVVHRLLIAPLPYADGNRIVKLVQADGGNVRSATPAMVRAWRDRARAFEMVAAVSVHALSLQDFGDPQDSIPAYVTSNYLTLLGLRPALGRGFHVEDERPGAPRVAMISYGKWQREFGGSDDVLGKTVVAQEIDGTRYTIVGVMPPNVTVPMSPSEGVNRDLRRGDPAIWIPAMLDSIADDHVFAKLRPRVSAAAASAEMQHIVDADPSLTPPARSFTGATGFQTSSRVRPRAMRARDFLDPRETQTVRVLFVAVGVLLLIACANVASLLMSRAWTRRREFAVRVALGAGRARLARQMLTESVLLAFAGGVAGVGVAWMTLEVILALRPASLEELGAVQIEQPVLLWSAAISLGTGLLFGVVPALFASRRPTGDVLRSEARSASGGTAARRMRSTLIVLEIAMSMVLLVGAGLLVRSFAKLQATPLNFEPRGLVSASILVIFPRNWTPEARTARRNEFVDRLRSIPGVTDATIGMMPGLGWRSFSLEAELSDGTTTGIGEYSVTFITPDYFRIAGMRLVAGRVPDSLAMRAEPRPVVVNRSLARRVWGESGRAIGSRLLQKDAPGIVSSYAIAGIVEDIQMPGRRTATGPTDVYAPVPLRLPGLPVLLRTTLSESARLAEIRRVVAELDRSHRGTTRMPYGAILQSVTAGERYVAEALAPTRFAMALLIGFALIALVLSAVGLYGVIAYTVTQRTREIGVRVALGADRRSVERLVVGAGLRLASLGLVIGVGGAMASTRLLSGLLYGVSPVDPLSFAAIAVLLVAIALLASYVPARRAVRIDPVAALRAE